VQNQVGKICDFLPLIGCVLEMIQYMDIAIMEHYDLLNYIIGSDLG